MRIGSSIALIAVGAIFAFAVSFDVAGIAINVVGYILIAAGLIGLIATLLMQRRTREVVHERPAEREVVRDRPAEREVRREREV